MTIKLVDDFRVDPNAVLAGALQTKLREVVVIGRHKNGKLYIAGSRSTPEVLALIAAAPSEIDRLATDEPTGSGTFERIA